MFYQTIFLYSKLILPWFLLGIILAYIVKRYIHPTVLKNISGKFNLPEILLLSVSGMISPLSIMSFLPLAREISKWGVPTSILFAFFISERAYDLQSFFIISGLFNLRFSVVVALVIFLSLVVTTYSLKREKISFKKRKKMKEDGFARRQIKTLLIVIIGIILGATLKTYIPEDYILKISGGKFGGIIIALIIGFSVYLGPILGNYPVAKAFSELGMSSLGVLTFLTISPILNLVIITLFASSVGLKKTFKATAVYSVTGLFVIFLLSQAGII